MLIFQSLTISIENISQTKTSSSANCSKVSLKTTSSMNVQKFLWPQWQKVEAPEWLNSWKTVSAIQTDHIWMPLPRHSPRQRLLIGLLVLCQKHHAKGATRQLFAVLMAPKKCPKNKHGSHSCSVALQQINTIDRHRFYRYIMMIILYSLSWKTKFFRIYVS